jgi:uncharacterized membrane protein YfcA
VVGQTEILLFIVATIGSCISALTGLGGGSIVLALLLMFYPPIEALALHSFTQLTSNFLRGFLAFKVVAWDVVWRYALLLIPGAFIAGKLMGLFEPAYLEILIGVMIIVSIYLPLPKRMQKLSKGIFIPLGFVSGFLGMMIGAVGPFVAPFFQRLGLTRESQLGTKSAAQMSLQLSRIIAFGGLSTISFSAIQEEIYILIVAVILGVGISIPISNKLSDKWFDRVVNVILTIIALKTIYSGISKVFI